MASETSTTDDGRLKDRVVLITGAASGIGRATAERMASEGAKLFLLDVQAEPLEEAAAAAAAHGGEVASQVCDVSDPAQVEASVSACIERFGKLDCLCNVAGILRMANAHELDLEVWNSVIAINLTGTFMMCKAALPHLLASGGNIINTSSTSALGGLPWGAAYGASKGGVLALTRTLAVEYGKQGLRANAVCPGSIMTPMTTRSIMPEGADMSLLRRVVPIDKPRGPETVAGVMAFLASDDAVHINGEEIRVDGGTLS